MTSLAWRLLCGGRAQEACALFEWLVSLMPARMELRLALAHALLSCGKPGAALAVLEALGSANDPAAHFLSGKALARVGRMTEARVAFDRYRDCRQARFPNAPF